LTRLTSEVVNHDGLYSHLANVCGVGTIKLRTQNLREIVINKHVF